VTITKGKWEKVGGVDSYVATPTGEYPQDKAILFLSDVFGPQLINAQVRFFYKLGEELANLMQIVHRSSSSLTTLLLTVSKLVVALLLIAPKYLISIIRLNRFRP
jgi:hypothetical protein